MPKVLFTASTFSHILNFHLPYLRAFQREGWEVHVACGGEEREVPWADRSFTLPFEKKITAPVNFAAAEKLRRLIKQERYALVVTHTSLAAFFTRLALRGLRDRPRCINVSHGYLFDDESSRAKRTLLLTAEKLTAGQTDLLLTMNAYDDALAERYPLAARTRHIPGIGVDFSRFDEPLPSRYELRQRYGVEQDAFVMAYAAEFSTRKGQTCLIRAMTQLPENTQLLLAGDGALLGECRDLIRELRLERRVILPGYLKRPQEAYALADAVVSASRIEGLPFNIMEAMYLGCPIVASDVKGNNDLIMEGRTGLLYPHGDEAAFAAQISRLMDSPALRQQLGAAAHDEVLQYGLDRVFPLVWDAYMSETEETVTLT